MSQAESLTAAAVPVASVSRRRLGVVVFTAGAGTLATEIAASRLLAPYFGSSTVVWANIIGLILVYLSIGYWIGGKVADRRPEPRLLGWIVLVAALVIAVLPFVARPVLDFTVQGLDTISVGAVVGSFFAALLLFAVPVTLLGAVSPFAVRLALDDVSQAGAVAGRLYALSTLGSIVGTFVSALVAIPLIGTQRTMLGAAALLVLAAALILGSRWQILTVGMAALLFVPAETIKATSGLVYETESAYQYIQVLQRSDGSRVLRLNEGIVNHSVWRPDTVLTGGEWDMFLVVPPLLDHPPERMLVIGNAGGTTARAFGELYPDVEIDGVEIDPKVTEVGRRYFGLGDNPRLHVVTADGRPYLAGTDKRYDIIAVDAYHQPYIPFYLATEEFFRLVRDHLAPGGAVALNVAAVPGDERLSDALGTTMLTAVPLGLALAGARVQPAPPRLPRAGVAGRAREPRRRDQPRRRVARPRVSRAAQPHEPHRRAAHRRPRPRRVADRPDDPRVRGPRRRARAGSAPDRARPVSLPKPAGGYLKVAHRGASALAPENSLAAVEAALAAEVDIVELDVLAVDGGLRLAHSAAQIQPDSPALEDALELFARTAQPRIWLDLDVKTPGHEEGIMRAVAAHGLLERTLVTSFHPQVLREAKAARARHCHGPRVPERPPRPQRATPVRRLRRAGAARAPRGASRPHRPACSPPPERTPPCSITRS